MRRWKQAISPQILDIDTIEHNTSKHKYRLILKNGKSIIVQTFINDLYTVPKTKEIMCFLLTVYYKLPQIAQNKLKSMDKDLQNLMSNYRGASISTNANPPWLKPPVVTIGYQNVHLEKVIESLEKIEDVLEKYLI